MDVVCERCQTEYEFDDALVSERGTTVKCTNCGHQFKIYRPSGDAAGAARPWSLRRPDGTTITFDSLAVLQKWIVEGRVTRADQISRAGEGWKPLGSIAELESFFATAELRGSSGSRPPAGAPAQASKPPPVPPAADRTGAQRAMPTTNARPPAPPPPPAGANAGGTMRPAVAAQPAAPAQPAASAAAPTIPGPPRAPTIGGYGPPPTVNGSAPAAAANAAPAAAAAFAPVAPPSSPPGPGFSMGAAGDTVRSEEKFDFGEDTGIVEQWKEEPPASTRSAPTRREPLAPGGARVAPAIGPPPVKRAATPTVADAPPPGRRHIPRDSDEPPTTSRDPDALGLPPDASVPPGRRAGPPRAVLAAGAAAVVVAGVGVAWLAGAFGGGASRPATTAAAPTDPRAAAVARTEQATRAATRASYDEAREQLTALLATDPGEPRLSAARAEVLALLGEQSRQHAEDLEARAAQPGAQDAATLRAEAALSRREVSTTLDRARQDVAAAEAGAARVATPAESARLHVSLGEAARVLGDMSSARRHLDAARAAGGGAAADLLAALLERDGGAADAAATHLRAAAAQPATAVRARLALARALAARGDAAGARAELDAVLRASAGHEVAQALVEAIGAQQAPFRAAGAAPAVAALNAADAGAALAPPGNAPPVVAQANPAGGNEPAGSSSGSTGGGATGSGGSFTGRSYDSLVAEGERLQERGQRERARQAFLAAVAARPDGSEAVTGLGFVELDSGSASVAVSHFRRALAINPRYSEAYIGLGQAYARQGDAAQAVRAYREYLTINPSGSRARIAQAQIDQLQARINPGGSGSSGSGEPGASGGSNAGSSGSSTGSSGSSGSGEPSGSSGSSGSTGSGGGSTGSGSGGAGSSSGSGSGSSGSSGGSGGSGGGETPPAPSGGGT